MNKIGITTQARILTDGSRVYDVHVGNVVMHCVSLDDAYDLAEKIKAAIEEHALDGAILQWGCCHAD